VDVEKYQYSQGFSCFQGFRVQSKAIQPNREQSDFDVQA